MTNNKTTIIIGGGLTGLTVAFYLKRAGKDFVLLEKSNRVGGAIKTEKDDYFTFEVGPSTGALSSPELVELFEDLGDACKLEVANQASKFRWIWKNNVWENLPSGIIGGIKTPLFTFSDKIRLLGEPFRRRGKNPDETVAELVLRRMGQSYLDYAVNPFVRGIYAGSPAKLTTRFALPKLYNLEQKYGSFIGGAVIKPRKKGREKKATGDVFSANGGLGNLIRALEQAVGDENICLNADGITVNPENQGFTVKFNKNNKSETIRAENVITTVGSFALPEILPFVEDDKMQIINNLEYARLAHIVLAYKDWDGLELKAFGGLIPEKEERPILGILFPTSLFENRTKGQGTILSVFAGGVDNPTFIDKDDDEIKNIVLPEVAQMLQTKATPDLIRICRYSHAIPQYRANSEQRYYEVNNLERKYKGLYIAGNLRDGVGIPHRVRQAKLLADKISGSLN